MGSKLLYGILFCLILWWLVRYYLLPWWKQSPDNEFDPDSDSPPSYPDAINQTAHAESAYSERAQAHTANPHAAHNVEQSPKQSPDPLQRQPDRIPTGDNSELTDTIVAVRDSELEGQGELLLDDVDLNATTDLQGQLEVLQQEKERTRESVRSSSNRKLHPAQSMSNMLSDGYVGGTSLDSSAGSNDELSAHIAVLEKQIDENNRDITMLCTELKEARRFEVRFNENDKRLAQKQSELLQLEDELRKLQAHSNKLGNVESQLKLKNKEITELRSDSVRSAALETDLREKNQVIHQLTLKAEKVGQLEALIASKNNELSQLQARQNDTASLSTRIEEQDRELELLGKREQQLSEMQNRSQEQEQVILQLRNAEKKTNVQLANREKTISDLQKQLAETGRLQQSLTEKEQELNRLRRAQDELQQSDSKIQAFGQSLSEAETESASRQQNDLELRRLRSELQSVTQELDKSAREVGTLQNHLVKQQQQIDETQALRQRAPELEKLESDILNRDRQISELQQRLAKLSRPSNQAPHTPPDAGDSAHPPAKIEVGGQTPVPQPLFTAPAERDDLKLIKGIGPVMERTLNSLGVTSFKQLSDFNQSDIDLVSNAIDAFPGRIERDDWVGGARAQYQKKYANKVDV